MTTLPIRRGSFADQVADDLRVRIISGDLAPGSHLVEGALADEYDVSRAPVREALQRLATERLVENGRRRGIYVLGLSAEDVEELYSLRLALEKLAFERAVTLEHPKGAWIPAEDALAAMRDASRSDDTVRFAERDLDFHRHFYTLAEHTRLTAFWEQYEPTFAALLRTTIRPVEDLDSSVAEHERLLEFAVAADLTGALAELTAHLGRAREAMGASRRTAAAPRDGDPE